MRPRCSPTSPVPPPRRPRRAGRLRDETLAACDEQLDDVAGAMAERLGAGGVLFTFGNGGSSTDAATVASLFRASAGGRAARRPLLARDEAVLTALSNDVGFELVFSRQIIAHAGPGDVAFGISTSGDSENVLRAFAEAKRRGLLTVGMAGYEGGRFEGSDDVDHCIVVNSDSVHRTQETQAVLSFELWDRVQRGIAR